MGKALCQEFARARETYEEASQAVGLDLAKLCFEDPDQLLGLTEYTQPAMLATDIAAWRSLEHELGMQPEICAGHSLGEYAALVAAGAMPFAEAVRAVRLRGKWMQEAMPEGIGGMAAVLNTPVEVIEDACEKAADGQVIVPANFNSPDQVVISGHVEALDRAVELIKQQGGRVRKLKVSGPFHCELMRPAAEKMSTLLKEIKFSDFEFPVIANLDAKP